MWPLYRLLVESGWRPRLVILRPGSIDAVRRIIEEAYSRGVCILVRGGRSNVVGALVPRRCCVGLDLVRMNRILEFNPGDGYIHVEAGIRLSDLESWLNERGYTSLYYPQSLGLATLGGSIAMLGSGAYMPGRGNIEDLIQWIDVVLPDGTHARLGSKENPRGWVGPGVKHLFIGSEGGLGIVVAAGLKVRPLRDSIDLAYSMPSFSKGLDAARKLVEWGRPYLVRLIHRDEASITLGADNHVLLARVPVVDEDLARAEEDYIDRVAKSMGGARLPGVFEQWWRGRYSYEEHLKQLLDAGLWFDTIDTAAAWSRVEALNSILTRRLKAVDGVIAVFSHAGHFYHNGASLYHTVVMERRLDTYWRVWLEAFKAVEEAGGSIVHQHGFGSLRRLAAPRELGDNLSLWCRIKDQLDPKGIFALNGLSRVCKHAKG